MLLWHDASSNWTSTGLQYIFIAQSLFMVEGHKIVTSWCIKQQLAFTDLGHKLHKMEIRFFIHFTPLIFFLFNIDSINCCNSLWTGLLTSGHMKKILSWGLNSSKSRNSSIQACPWAAHMCQNQITAFDIYHIQRVGLLSEVSCPSKCTLLDVYFECNF